MTRREAQSLCDELMTDACSRPQGGNHHVVGFVATTGKPDGYFGGAVDVGTDKPYDDSAVKLDFGGAVTLACRKLAEMLAPRNVGHVFSVTGTLVVRCVRTGEERIFTGDAT